MLLFTLLNLDLNDEVNKEEEETCENCNLTKPKTAILIHIGQTRACKAHYGERFKAMKALNEQERQQRSRARIGKEKVSKQQRPEENENNNQGTFFSYTNFRCIHAILLHCATCICNQQIYLTFEKLK